MRSSDKVRVGVGLSGGADSAAACLKLLRSGYEVTGFTMVVDEGGWATGEKAGRVADKLGIEHVCVDVRREFKELVVDRFVEDYGSGLTPSPCVVCNRKLKFGVLWDAMSARGCEKIATGHYAELRLGVGGRHELWRGHDGRKDQSYFLAQLTQAQLSRILFPLSGSVKTEIQDAVRELGIIPRSEGESQDLCFVPGGDYGSVVLSYRPDLARRGRVLEYGSGRVLGHHGGAFLYTPGQRRGLGLGGGPWFVVRTDPVRNTVTVAHAGDFRGGEGLLRGMNWLDGEPEAGAEFHLDIQIRHQMRPCAGVLTCLEDGCARLRLENRLTMLPPGQLAVGYEGDRVVASGWICREDEEQRS